MHFSLRQIEVFAAIARGKNVSSAAELLHMSQSAASTALAELERRFGMRLFDRAGRRLKLNEKGRTILPQALELIARAEELEMRLSGSESPGPLRVGATVTIGNYLAPGLIEQYRLRYPDAAITLEVGNTDAICASVADFDLDFALVEGEYSSSALAFTAWKDDELVVFCAPSHRLAQQPACTIAQVLEEKWAVRERGSGTRQALDRAMADHWSRWKIGIELQHMEAIRKIVEAGQMLGCLPRLALSDSLRDGRLAELRVRGLRLMRKFYWVAHREKYWTAGMLTFRDLCKSESHSWSVEP